jgi:hypothetical protein
MLTYVTDDLRRFQKWGSVGRVLAGCTPAPEADDPIHTFNQDV